MSRYHLSIVVTMDTSEALTSEEVEHLRRCIERQAGLFAVGIRPQGRGKGYGVYATTHSVDVTAGRP